LFFYVTVTTELYDVLLYDTIRYNAV